MMTTGLLQSRAAAQLGRRRVEARRESRVRESCATQMAEGPGVLLLARLWRRVIGCDGGSRAAVVVVMQARAC